MDEQNLNTELITKCLSKTATEAEKQELWNWICLSRENEDFYFRMKDLYEAGNWKSLKIEAQTPRSWEQLKDKIQNEQKETAPKYIRLLQVLKYAAVLIIGVVISAMFFQKNTNTDLTNNIVTGIGERTQVVLPDGTRIWVNSCSSVSYSYDYGTNSRNVYLKGEAYFQVAKNKELPFIVHSSGMRIQALGTSFNVSAYDNDGELSAVLLEGSISFKQSDGNEEVLTPGQKLTFSKASQKTAIEQVNAEAYVAWSHGETRFEHLKMEEITKRLQRIYHVTFVLDNEKIKNMHFTGTFRNYESLDQILKVINTNTNLDIKVVRDTVYMK